LSLARNGDVKLELDHREKRAVRRSLADRKALLVENAQDTTRQPVTRRAASLELMSIDSVLSKLRVQARRGVSKSQSED
jgi:hypothetical protein